MQKTQRFPDLEDIAADMARLRAVVDMPEPEPELVQRPAETWAPGDEVGKVYVDPPIHRFRGAMYCHLVADTDRALEAMARKLGLDPAWRQGSGAHLHYDITDGLRSKALRLGAVAVTAKGMGIVMRAKRQRRKTEQGLREARGEA